MKFRLRLNGSWAHSINAVFLIICIASLLLCNSTQIFNSTSSAGDNEGLVAYLHRRVLPERSACSSAFGNETVLSLRANYSAIPSVFNFKALPHSTMKLVNVGFGTTGTRTIADEDCRQHYMPCCHWKKCKPGSFRSHYGLLYHFIELQGCVRNHTMSTNCETQIWMEKARKLIVATMMVGLKAVHDNPTQFFYREYLDLVPQLTVQHSVRDPFTWVLKRIAEHEENDLLCDMHQPRNYAVSSPFHILECMLGSKYVFDNLTTMAKYMNISGEHAKEILEQDADMIAIEQRSRINEVAEFYADFTRRVLSSLSIRNNYTPICVWDGNFP